MGVAWWGVIPHAGVVDTITIGEFIAGVVAGSFITMGGTLLLEWLRGRREDKRRFHQQRQVAYARYLALTALDVWTRDRRRAEEHWQLEQDWAHALAEVRILASPRFDRPQTSCTSKACKPIRPYLTN